MMWWRLDAALKQVEEGRTADDVARECGVSKHTIYAWKAKFGGMDASEGKSEIILGYVRI